MKQYFWLFYLTDFSQIGVLVNFFVTVELNRFPPYQELIKSFSLMFFSYLFRKVFVRECNSCQKLLPHFRKHNFPDKG